MSTVRGEVVNANRCPAECSAVCCSLEPSVASCICAFVDESVIPSLTLPWFSENLPAVYDSAKIGHLWGVIKL